MKTIAVQCGHGVSLDGSWDSGCAYKSGGKQYTISTHAPRVRRDLADPPIGPPVVHFYSRASCEARPSPPDEIMCFDDFYSRASCEARPIRLRNRREL